MCSEARPKSEHEEELKAAVVKTREEATKAAAFAVPTGPGMISREEREQAPKVAID